MVIPITFAHLFGWSINTIALMIIFRQLIEGYALFFIAFMILAFITIVSAAFIQGGLEN